MKPGGWRYIDRRLKTKVVEDNLFHFYYFYDFSRPNFHHKAIALNNLN